MLRVTLLLLLAATLRACSTARMARDYACSHREEIKAITDNGCAIPLTTEAAPQ